MLRKSLTAIFVSLSIAGSTGAAFAAPPAAGNNAQASAKLSDTFSTLYAVNQWSVEVSKMADTRAKSDLVKDYARQVVAANSSADTNLMNVAQKGGLNIQPLSPDNEEGRACSTARRGRPRCSALSKGMPSTRST
jgi:predicted outer membrane protein